MQALVETTRYTVIMCNTQDKRSGLQAPVEQGQNNSVNMNQQLQCCSNQNRKKSKMHSTLILQLV